jgi:glycosyltransferase involved in cell wall biosynthesis
VALLTGGFDRPYVFGLSQALLSQGIRLDVIGSDDVDGPEMHRTPRLSFLNFHGTQRKDLTLARKLSQVLALYAQLCGYAFGKKAKVFHILWNNKLQLFDRTILMLYYKLCGKRIALTAHNVNAGKRDANDSALNRITLKIQYQLADHIFVHTEKMKAELVADFNVRESAVTVIPFGINNAVPDTDLTSTEAKHRLGIRDGERTVLFFGIIGPYKGHDLLFAAFQKVAGGDTAYRLVIAGKPRGGCERYLKEIQEAVGRYEYRERVIFKIEYIPDAETELYFKAADVLVLPYTQVFQSGVLVLGYSFGLPVIATDVGSFRDDIVEGKTGFLCRPCDPSDLAGTIQRYFESDLFKDLSARRQEIKDYSRARFSWDVVGQMTRDVYTALLDRTAL